MSSVAGQLSFEVLRFAAAPVSGEVALLELEGRLRAGVTVDPTRPAPEAGS